MVQRATVWTTEAFIELYFTREGRLLVSQVVGLMGRVINTSVVWGVRVINTYDVPIIDQSYKYTALSSVLLTFVSDLSTE